MEKFLSCSLWIAGSAVDSCEGAAARVAIHGFLVPVPYTFAVSNPAKGLAQKQTRHQSEQQCQRQAGQHSEYTMIDRDKADREAQLRTQLIVDASRDKTEDGS
jgi:hypothetical protein